KLANFWSNPYKKTKTDKETGQETTNYYAPMAYGSYTSGIEGVMLPVKITEEDYAKLSSSAYSPAEAYAWMDYTAWVDWANENAEGDVLGLSAAPGMCAEASVASDGSFSFAKLEAEPTVISASATVDTESKHGQYYVSLDESAVAAIASAKQIYGAVVKADGKEYALRHLKNIYYKDFNDFAVNTTAAESQKGQTYSEADLAYYADLEGETITEVDYYTSSGVFTVETEAALGASAPEPTNSDWADGTYEGTGTGFGGDVVMSVTVKDGVITEITPVSHEGENFWVVYETELNNMIEAIRQQGSTDGIDAVSGATKSSKGIMEAVEMALKLASGWQPEPPKPFDPSFFASGDGSEANPWVIKTKEQLNAFAVSMTEAEGGDYAGKYVRLDSDIDLTGEEWTPIGEHKYGFAGSFDGGNHTVNGMTMGTAESPADNKDAEGYWAFFSILNETARVKDLNLTNVSIAASSSVGLSVGGVAGVVTNSDNSYDNWKGAVVDHCSVTGTMTAVQDPGSVNLLAGGITSFLYKGAVINCMTDVDISCTVRNGGGWIEAGGITGMNNRGLVANCYTLGDIRGEADDSSEDMFGKGYSIITPLVGFNAGYIASCYESGSVTSVDSSRGLGLLTAYMTMGGLYDCWYSDAATVTKAGASVDPANPIGAKGPVYSEGLYNVDAVVGNVESFSSDTYAALADKLNAVLPAYPVDLSVFGLSDECLMSWTVKDGTVTFGETTVKSPYVRPAADYVYPDMKALRDAIAKAKAVDRNKYTESSLKTMDDALSAAEEILPKYQELASQEETDEASVTALNESAASAAKTLEDAVKNLAAKPSRNGGGGGGGGSSAPSTYAVTPAAAVNGTLSVSADKAKSGDKVTVTVKPNDGYKAESLKVTDKNGREITVTDNKDGTYTYTMPASAVTVSASFVPADTAAQADAPGAKGFVDVPGDAYFGAPVDWAVEKGITAGVDDTHFAPDASCTRAQMVTFLWRAAGSPAPAVSENPFADVDKGSYYEQAVLWAVEKGITLGTDAEHFSPDAAVNRAQSVTFLYRLSGEKTDGENPFADVAGDAYCYDAVLWAVGHNVTNGTAPGVFSPDDDCTRGQIVTLLYRSEHPGQ
ncbi:MAG: S-layer homology domain-containing protein, partial [Clostridia bacterium]|nr:S-layer homology domain-containing protein [Clostridia bacterium]